MERKAVVGGIGKRNSTTFSSCVRNNPVKSNCHSPAAILKGLIILFRYYLDRIIDFIFSLFWDGKYEALPDLEKNFNFLAESATSLARKIKSRQLKSEDLVRACIERIKVVNPVINAVTDERFEEALKEACEVDMKIEEGPSVPFTAKESHQVAGLLNTLGIQARRYIRACTDAECVRLLREAGAIPLAVTNVPEINKWQETRNMVFGQTNNPYHPGRTCGGSSGGEAALSASFATPISLCNVYSIYSTTHETLPL
ncbi:Fatty-acid amide hydrolase 2 [Eumeta japonica]|uniref:Fatty-acid amide hydrolase 2 n=1 Tax=Eumeta variegata TaxID=151549 RepID=A0A4C1ZWQ5_EUMVA|nr:Fatty-acid amide hydrolase 2 [Eumeta japonica]